MMKNKVVPFSEENRNKGFGFHILHVTLCATWMDDD